MHFTRRFLLPVILVGLVISAWFGPLDSLATKQVDEGLKRALVSFATARTLNALISVVQGTEVAVEPLGVGVNFAPGQILDPFNDLVETFSQLMLVASVSFGIQKILLVIGGQMAVSILFTATAILCLGVSLMGRALPPWLAKVLIIMVVFRFAVPAVSVGSDMVYQHFLASDYQLHQAAIDSASKEVEGLSQKTLATAPTPPPQEVTPDKPVAQQEGWLDELWNKTKERANQFGKTATEVGKSASDGFAASVDVSARIDKFKAAAEKWTEDIVMLIVIFLLQTLLIPLVLLWALLSFTKGVIRSQRFNSMRLPWGA